MRNFNKIVLAGALLLLAAGCKTQSVGDVSNSNKPLQSVPEAIDSGKADQPKADCHTKPADSKLVYRNQSLNFEVQPGTFTLDKTQSNDKQIVFTTQQQLISGDNSQVYAGSVSVQDSDKTPDQLRSDLQKDSNNDNIKTMNVDCEQAVSYQDDSGMVPIVQIEVIHNGKLYIIDGQLTDPAIMATFRFLN